MGLEGGRRARLSSGRKADVGRCERLSGKGIGLNGESENPYPVRCQRADADATVPDLQLTTSPDARDDVGPTSHHGTALEHRGHSPPAISLPRLCLDGAVRPWAFPPIFVALCARRRHGPLAGRAPAATWVRSPAPSGGSRSACPLLYAWMRIEEGGRPPTPRRPLLHRQLLSGLVFAGRSVLLAPGDLQDDGGQRHLLLPPWRRFFVVLRLARASGRRCPAGPSRARLSAFRRRGADRPEPAGRSGAGSGRSLRCRHGLLLRPVFPGRQPAREDGRRGAGHLRGQPRSRRPSCSSSRFSSTPRVHPADGAGQRGAPGHGLGQPCGRPGASRLRARAAAGDLLVPGDLSRGAWRRPCSAGRSSARS